MTRIHRYDEHPIWDQIEALDTKLQEIQGSESELDPESVLTLERLCNVSHHVIAAFDRSNPALVPIALLDDIHSPLNQMVSYLTDFATDNNPDRLSSASDAADHLMIDVSKVPVVITNADVGQVRDSVSSLHRAVGQYLRNIKERDQQSQSALEAVQNQADQLSSDLQAESKRVDHALQDFQERSDTAISNSQNNVDSITTEFQQQFSTAQERRVNEFGQLISETEKDFKDFREQQVAVSEQTLEELQESAEQTADELRAKSTDILDSLGTCLEQAKNLVSLTGDVSQKGHYQRNAKAEKKVADRWSYVAFTCIGLACVTIIYLILASPTESLEWIELVRRLTISPLFLAAAAYAGRESGIHRNREQLYRAMELELASLSPFISTLEPNLQAEIRRSLVSRYFQGHGDGLTASWSEDLANKGVFSTEDQ